jgi:hypothetical protein
MKSGVKHFLLGLSCLLLCSCESVTYDMRRLEQPVLLNSLSAPGQTTTAGYELIRVEDYTAEVWVTSSFYSQGDTDVTETSTGNQAQINAFMKIGGDTNCVIHAMALDIDVVAVNAVLFLADDTRLKSVGEVAQIRTIALTNAPNLTPAAP